MRLPGRALKRFPKIVVVHRRHVDNCLLDGYPSRCFKPSLQRLRSITTDHYKSEFPPHLDDTEKGPCGSTSLARRSPLPPSNATTEPMIHQAEWIT